MCISHLFLPAPPCSSAFPAYGLKLWFGTNTISKRKRRYFSAASAQILFGRQHTTFYILLACLFLLSLEITGEPHASDDARSQFPAFYMHQQQQQLANGGDGVGSGNNNSSSGGGGVTVFQHQTTTTATPEHSGSLTRNGNQRDERKENMAPVIASSFRTVDSQVLNSNEEEGYGYQNSTSKTKSHEKLCNRSIPAKCLGGLPPMNDIGIPSSPQAVDTACRFYNSGMSCVDSWMKKCMHEKQRQKLMASIAGAHETYSFLCKDSRFRADFLKYKDCYKKLSRYWDDCSRQFIEGLKRNSELSNSAFCCIRLEYLSCVKSHSLQLCGYNATRFSMKMAETLVRSSNRNHIPEHCVNIRNENCIPINGSLMILPTILNSSMYSLIFTCLVFIQLVFGPS